MQSQEAKGRGLRNLILGTLATVILQAHSWAAVDDPPPDHPGAGAQAPQRYAKGRILVQPRAGMSDDEIDRALKQHQGKRGKRLQQINVHVVELPAHANERAVVNALRRNPHFKFAELDELVAPDLTPNDPYFASAWHLPKIQAQSAWDVATGAGVTIAILDTGVYAGHPDLIGKLVPGWNVVKNSADTADVYGHGSKVAGAAAASTSNALGVAGVGWFSKIMPVRIDDGTGYASFSAMAAGIIWAADHGAKVANISYMGPATSSTVQSAAQYMRGKGGVVVCSAGNSGLNPGYPASSAVTVVSATGSTDVRTSWSNFGAYVDVSAPGSGIWATNNAGTYSSVSGTSFSSPITAGIYALMMSANPALSPSTLDSVLFTTVTDLGTAGYDIYYGHGRVNASAAVAKARTTVQADSTRPIATITSPTSGTVSGVAAVNVSASDNIGVTKVELYVGTTRIATDTTSPYAFSWDTRLVTDGAKTLQAKAYDAAGNVGSSALVSVTVANNTTAPTVSISSPSSGSTASGTLNIAASATDDVSVVGMAVLIDGQEVAASNSGSISYTWYVPAPKGKKTSASTTATITVLAIDAAGNLGSAQAIVQR